LEFSDDKDSAWYNPEHVVEEYCVADDDDCIAREEEREILADEAH